MSPFSSGRTFPDSGTGSRPGPLIAAPATPVGPSALAVVRFSGEGVAGLLRRMAPKLPDPIPARCPTLVTLVDARGEPIDRGLLTWFPAPGSYTGEDLAEFSGHGNPRLVERILRVAFEAGAAPAEPGEFTLRAFLNGKLDLSGAEAVRDLVEARSELASRLALGRLEGGRGGTGLGLPRATLRELLAVAEGVVDFSDSDEAVLPGVWSKGLEGVRSDLGEILDRSARLDRIERGVSLVLVGPPNAGKSTLFNRIVQEDRALVSSVPGTTRDLIREVREFLGLRVEVVDTAGIIETTDPVEEAAVDRARRAAESADLLVVVVGPGSGAWRSRLELGRKMLGAKKGFVVLSHCDGGVPAGENSEGADFLALSARSGFGWERFEVRLAELSGCAVPQEALLGDRLGEHRQRRVRQALESLERVAELVACGRGLEEVAFHLRDAYRTLGEADGEELSEGLLHEIFSTFCIGK